MNFTIDKVRNKSLNLKRMNRLSLLFKNVASYSLLNFSGCRTTGPFHSFLKITKFPNPIPRKNTRRDNFSRSSVRLSPLHSFLTELTMTTVIGTLKLTSFFNLIPLSVESSVEGAQNYSLRVEKFGWGWRLVAWHLVNWILFFAQIFQITSCTHTLMSDVRGNAYAVHICILIGSLFGSIFVLTVYVKQKEWILLLRQHEKLLGTISGESLQQINSLKTQASLFVDIENL